jgi:soluble lytic murein transglycosylase-like protein
LYEDLAHSQRGVIVKLACPMRRAESRLNAADVSGLQVGQLTKMTLNPAAR